MEAPLASSAGCFTDPSHPSGPADSEWSCRLRVVLSTGTCDGLGRRPPEPKTWELGARITTQNPKRPRSHSATEPLLPPRRARPCHPSMLSAKLADYEGVRQADTRSVRRTPGLSCAVHQHEAEYHERPGRHNQSHANRLRGLGRRHLFRKHFAFHHLFPGRLFGPSTI